MRFDAGTTDVPSAGTAVQISNGFELEAGDSKTENFGDGSVAFSAFYVDAATNGDDVDWTVILL
jgi:hypothetical protein